MMTMNYMTCDTTEVMPAWMKTERYDYCDQNRESSNLFSNIFGRLFRNK